jgi:hypothetical protein
MTIKLARVAPIEPQEEQVDGGGWAWRYKIRILGKHTQDKNILSDEDLPWAQVIMPVTAGSGAANYATSPMINQGDTVTIEYYDDDEQQPVITGVLPRTKKVSTGEPDDTNGYLPHSGYTERRDKNEKQVEDETNESNKGSQSSTRSDKFSSVFGDTTVLADGCDPNSYKINAVISILTNLFNAINKFSEDEAYIETIVQAAIDRIHAIVNPFVGQIFNALFEGLVPILNQGLSALYKQVFAAVLSATGGNVIAATLAAQAALIALQPAIMALQQAISMLSAKTVADMLGDVDDLVRDAVDNNDDFTRCAAEDFAAAMINDIIDRTDIGMQPLLVAVVIILALASVGGGFSAGVALRGTLGVLKDLTGALLSPNQGGKGKCSGTVNEYAFGIGPVSDVGDILDNVIDSANTAKALVETAESLADDVDELLRVFGDFPFMSATTSIGSILDDCSTLPPPICYGPEIVLFGGRGDGAEAVAIVGNSEEKNDPRIAGNSQGGILAIDVTDGGFGYEYPPYVDIRDNCGLGIGAVARAVLKGDRVDRIYMVNTGENYPSISYPNLGGERPKYFYTDFIVIIDGGTNYSPGIIVTPIGEFEVITNEDGQVIEIIPIRPRPITEIPYINIPNVSPPIPPGGNLVEIVDRDRPDGGGDGVGDDGLVVVDSGGRNLGPAIIGRGLNFYPVLKELPTLEQLQAGIDIPESLSQEDIVFIIDCIQS